MNAAPNYQKKNMRFKKHGKPEKEMYHRKCWVCGSTEHVKNDCPKHKNKGDNGDAVNNEVSMIGIFLGMALCGDIIRYYNMGCLKSRNIIFIFISDTVAYFNIKFLLIRCVVFTAVFIELAESLVQLSYSREKDTRKRHSA